MKSTPRVHSACHLFSLYPRRASLQAPDPDWCESRRPFKSHQFSAFHKAPCQGGNVRSWRQTFNFYSTMLFEQESSSPMWGKNTSESHTNMVILISPSMLWHTSKCESTACYPLHMKECWGRTPGWCNGCEVEEVSLNWHNRTRCVDRRRTWLAAAAWFWWRRLKSYAGFNFIATEVCFFIFPGRGSRCSKNG